MSIGIVQYRLYQFTLARILPSRTGTLRYIPKNKPNSIGYTIISILTNRERVGQKARGSAGRSILALTLSAPAGPGVLNHMKRGWNVKTRRHL